MAPRCRRAVSAGSANLKLWSTCVCVGPTESVGGRQSAFVCAMAIEWQNCLYIHTFYTHTQKYTNTPIHTRIVVILHNCSAELICWLHFDNCIAFTVSLWKETHLYTHTHTRIYTYTCSKTQFDSLHKLLYSHTHMHTNIDNAMHLLIREGSVRITTDDGSSRSRTKKSRGQQCCGSSWKRAGIKKKRIKCFFGTFRIKGIKQNIFQSPSLTHANTRLLPPSPPPQ